jgi:phosphohistidine phosphatase
MPETYTLYLVRHAIAAEQGAAYPDDSKRPLTSRGIEKFKKVARGFARLDPGVDLVVTSPFARARQTADLLARALPGHPPVVETRALTPNADFDQFLDELGLHTRRAGIALVGHEPSLPQFVQALLDAHGAFELKKGAIVCIEVDRLPPSAPGRLVWSMPPKTLARLAD